MKIVTLLGSPRKNGNTATILKAFEEQIKGKCEIERINIIDKQIEGCLGCDACTKNQIEPGCVQKDDFKEIVGKIMLSDIVVYAAPVYVWDFPAQMKALMDRHYCLAKYTASPARFFMENKRTILLTTCGGPAENNADLLEQIFMREMSFLHCRMIGKYVLQCEAPSTIGEKKNKIAAQMISDIFKDEMRLIKQ